MKKLYIQARTATAIAVLDSGFVKNVKSMLKAVESLRKGNLNVTSKMNFITMCRGRGLFEEVPENER